MPVNLLVTTAVFQLDFLVLAARKRDFGTKADFAVKEKSKLTGKHRKTFLS